MKPSVPAIFRDLSTSLGTGQKLDLVLGTSPQIGRYEDGAPPQGIFYGVTVTALDRERMTFKTDVSDDPEPVSLVWQIRRNHRATNFPHDIDVVSESVQRVRALDWYHEPRTGASVYVGSSFYIDHGWDDFVGGKATIKDVDYNWLCPNDFNRITVAIDQRPGVGYNWYPLMEKQPEHEERYGDQVAHEDPEYHPFYAPHGSK